MSIGSRPFEKPEPMYFFIDNLLFYGEVDSITVDRQLGPYGISPAQAQIIIKGVEIGQAPPEAENAPHFSSKARMLTEAQRRLPCPASSE